jgi:hypothetical protein
MSDVRLRVRTIAVGEVETAAEKLDIKFENQIDNVDPITGFIVIGGGLAAGSLVIRLWHEFRGGTVIDLTKTPIDISRNRNLDWGYFLFIAKDGSVTVEGKDEPKTALERMVTAVLGLASNATLTTLKKAAEDSLGANAKVTLKPA